MARQWNLSWRQAVAPSWAMRSPSVSIKATSTPSCEVPLISPIAKTGAVAADGQSNAICSDMMLKGCLLIRLPHRQGLLHTAPDLLHQRRRRVAAPPSRIARRMIPKSGYRLSGKITRK
jgi:hypothetical protein